ncbi:MAG TPA: homoserine kinase [Steroidobacteraceae bacterium]|nr:homoserine kinase [Steroidobacteraceae bacterium]
MDISSATAFAPASVGNVGVGFDVLGHAFPALGDRVRARRSTTPGVRITAISGAAPDLPLEPGRNTAGRAVQSLLAGLRQHFGVDLSIEKGIPVGSGLGGSAASAVAAAVAVNELLDQPLAREALLPHAVAGEVAASGSPHADNVAPALLGGLVLTVGPVARRIPVPPAIRCVLVHPRLQLETRAARRMLSPSVPLPDFVRQSANLAGVIAGCYAGDLDLIRAAFADVVIEPQRAPLVPGFASVKAAALDAGAIGCSISGAGPSVFAWCEEGPAATILCAMQEAFASAGQECDGWIAAVEADGARVEERA